MKSMLPTLFDLCESFSLLIGGSLKYWDIPSPQNPTSSMEY